MTTDPLAWVRAEMDAAEEVALGAKGQTLGRWKEDDGPAEDIDLYAASGKLTMGQARHIARHDPAAVLRRIKAERKVLDECEQTIAASLIDDYPAPNLARAVIRGVAEGWGWTEATA